jgi:hypothetical protein
MKKEGDNYLVEKLKELPALFCVANGVPASVYSIWSKKIQNDYGARLERRGQENIVKKS